MLHETTRKMKKIAIEIILVFTFFAHFVSSYCQKKCNSFTDIILLQQDLASEAK